MGRCADLTAEPADDARCKHRGCPRHRRPFRKRDCCGKCAYLVEYLAIAHGWKQDQLETLKQVPIGGAKDPVTGRYDLLTDALDKAEFAIWKNVHIRQIESKLRKLRRREEARRGIDIDGLTLELKLSSLQRAIRRRAQYPGNPSWLKQMFDHEQLTALYCLLDDIEEHIPVPRIIDLGEVYKLISEHRGLRRCQGNEVGPGDPSSWSLPPACNVGSILA
jgi:hypothetical protein